MSYLEEPKLDIFLDEFSDKELALFCDELSSQHNSPISEEFLIDFSTSDIPTSSPEVFLPDFPTNQPQFIQSNQIEENIPKKRGRKRLRVDESADVSAVQLGDDELRTISSADLEEIIQKRLNGRVMTVEERLEFQKQKRRIKNRESALAHRQKKKKFSEEVNKERDMCKRELDQLRQNVERLENENNYLKKENMTLKQKLNQIHDAAKHSGNLSLQAIKQFGEFSQPSENVKKVGSTLFILFLSFGLILNLIVRIPFDWSSDNNGLSQRVNPFPQARTLLDYGSPDSNASIFDPNDPSFDSEDSSFQPPEPLKKRKRTSDSPKEISNSLTESKEISNSLPQSEEISNLFSESEELSNLFSESKEIPSNLDSFNQLRSTNKQTTQVPFTTSLEGQVTSFGEFMNESAPANFSKLLEHEISHPSNQTELDFWKKVDMKPNTAFLKIDSLQQLSPPESKPLDQNSPIYLSLLIPSSALNSHESDSFVQILTQLVDVSQSQLPSDPQPLDLDYTNMII